jgi:hypothetical protein
LGSLTLGCTQAVQQCSSPLPQKVFLHTWLRKPCSMSPEHPLRKWGRPPICMYWQYMPGWNLSVYACAAATQCHTLSQCLCWHVSCWLICFCSGQAVTVCVAAAAMIFVIELGCAAEGSALCSCLRRTVNDTITWTAEGPAGRAS